MKRLLVVAVVALVACKKAAPDAAVGSGSGSGSGSAVAAVVAVDAAIDAAAVAVPMPVASDRAVAGLDLKMPEGVVVKLLGAPTSKSPLAPDEDLQRPTSTLRWAANPGLEVKLAKGDGDTNETLEVIEVTLEAPSTLATTKHIHVGSTRAELLAAYGQPDSDNPMNKGVEIIAWGSLEDSLIIDLDHGKVTTIARTPVADGE